MTCRGHFHFGDIIIRLAVRWKTPLFISVPYVFTLDDIALINTPVYVISVYSRRATQWRWKGPPSGVFSRMTASYNEIQKRWAGLCDNAVPKSLQLAMDANSSKPIEVSQLLVTHTEHHVPSHHFTTYKTFFFFKNPHKTIDFCRLAGSRCASVFRWVIIWIFFKRLCWISFETRWGQQSPQER